MPDTGFSVCPHCGWNKLAPATSALYLSPGTLVQAPYQVAKVLGHGGFGITYLGWDANLQIKVAIKEYLPRDFATRDPQTGNVVSYGGDAARHFNNGLQQFLDEARTLARFQQHAGIVSVLTFFRAFGTGYMVMEYVEGETLRTHLQQGKVRLNWDQTLGIFMHIMDALRAVHAVGLLHRDIAPDNIYLCNDGRIKLLDFGAARQNLASDGRTLTIVKPGFAPEEQYRDTGVQGAWSDVYSVAASMYYCLTGVVPPDAMSRLNEDTLKPPSEYGAALPPTVEASLMAGLAVRASQRPYTIGEFQKSLLAQAESIIQITQIPKSQSRVKQREALPSSQTPPESIYFIEDEPRRGLHLNWLLAAGVAILMLVVVYNHLRNAEPQQQPPKTPLAEQARPAGDTIEPADAGGEPTASQPAYQEPTIGAEELKRHQQAALQRFEERRRQEAASGPAVDDQDVRLRGNLRSLCSEWGATMECDNGSR